MRILCVLFLFVLNSTVHGQVYEKAILYSPDKNFSLRITTSPLSDLNTDWKYWLITDSSDTTLLTTTITHDEFPPVVYWSKDSRVLIFEDQTHENNDNKIILYDLLHKKIAFETLGFIWGNGVNNFDEDSGFLFYFKRSNETSGNFNLLVLNIETKEIKTLSSATTSGDPVTGFPEIESINTAKKQLTLLFEAPSYGRTEKKIVDY